MSTILELDAGMIGGHWVTIDEHPVYIKDPIGSGKGFSRAELRRKILAHHEEIHGHEAMHADHAFHEAGGGNETTFYKKLPGEVNRYLEGNEGARRLFRVTDDPGKAGGSDAMSAMGEDKYFSHIDAAAGNKLNAALDTARTSPDPAMRFAAAIHDNMPPASDRVAQTSVPANQLRAGQKFTIQGETVRVVEDADGFKVLKGENYPETPLESLDKVPVDKGSIRSDVRRGGSKSIAPFSADYILHLDDTGDGKALPLGLTGLPTQNDAGEPIHYRRVKIAEAREWTHRGTGEKFDITPDRIEEWKRNTAALATKGVKPFIPGEHREKFNAKDNHGYVLGIEREGKDAFAVVALHGDDSLKVAARNGRSIYIKRDMLDADGKVYPGEALHHLALVPNPALPDLGGTVRIAASADGAAVPVFTLASAQPKAALSRRSFKMKPELATQVREKLGLGADKYPDDKLDDACAEKALALSADNKTLTTERDTAKADATAKANEVLALSANDKELDQHTMINVTRAMKSTREKAVASGVISEGGLKELDAIFLPNGKPGKIALSLSANPKDGGQDWLYNRVLDVIASNPGVKTSNEIPRDVQARKDAEDAIALSLSGDPTKVDASKLDRQAELLKQQLGTK